jgi:abelson tyrosine-protein kinase 1
VLGTAVDVAHEALLLSVEPLSMLPIPGLNEAAKTLLLVWDALEQVEVRSQ